VGPLIAVFATYKFVRLPRARVRSNGAVFAFAVFAPVASQDPRSISQNAGKPSAIIGRDEICTQRGLSSIQAAAAIAMTAS
jgi:hypothetical protein